MKKKILFVALACMLVLTTACGKKNKDEEGKKNDPAVTEPEEVANTNEGVVKEYEGNGFRIDNVTLIINKTTGSTYTSTVTNTSETAMQGVSLDMVITDKDGNEMITMPGSTGQIIAPGASVVITSSTDMDLKDAFNLTYVMK